MLHALDDVALHGDHARALRSRLARVPALEVARIDDVRIARDHLAGVHVAERPVVVALRAHRLDRRRRVRLVPLAPVDARVEEADVEEPGHAVRVLRGEVLGGDALGEALPVNGDPRIAKLMRLGLARRQLVDVRGEAERLDDGARGVVVAAHDHDGHVRLAQARHLGDEEEARRVVLPRPVEDVAREQEHVRALLDAERDQVLERATRGSPEALHRCALVAIEAAERAVDVEVGRVDDLQSAPTLVERVRLRTRDTTNENAAWNHTSGLGPAGLPGWAHYASAAPAAPRGCDAIRRMLTRARALLVPRRASVRTTARARP